MMQSGTKTDVRFAFGYETGKFQNKVMGFYFTLYWNALNNLLVYSFDFFQMIEDC